jgi:hypothetical protein
MRRSCGYGSVLVLDRDDAPRGTRDDACGRSTSHLHLPEMRPAGPAWADGAVVPLNLGAWWSEAEYKVCGTFQTRGYFILRKLHELDPARFLAVTAKIYHKQEKEPQDITKGEWKVILEHLGASPDEVKDVQVKMGKWR